MMRRHHFWISLSYETEMGTLMAPPTAMIGDLDGDMEVECGYSYANVNKDCVLPPTIRDREDLQYLGEGYILDNDNLRDD